MTDHVRRRWPDPAVWGAVVWSATVLAATAGVAGLTLVDAMLLLAILVIVPAAVPLHPAGGRGHAAVSVVAGMPAAPALLLERGALAAVLVLPWLVMCLAATALATTWWWSSRRAGVDAVWLAAAAYLAVGAGWLLADRLDLEPVGVTAPLVQLTAIHFHYAGFISAVLAGCAARRRPERLPILAAILVVVAPPIVAVGFTTYGPLQILGAVLLTTGIWLLAWETVRRVAPAVGGVAAAVLIVSALATLAPMVLAVQWAVGANYATPALSIPDMARVHGVTNAVGFGLLGVLGWRLRPRDPDPAVTR